MQTSTHNPQAAMPRPELALDHSPSLESAMRDLFDTRWKRWHLCKTYEQAVQDPVTRRLLTLAVQHMPGTYGLRRTERCKKKTP
jgi:hypothetical protein